MEIMEKYHIQKWHLKLKKNTLKKILKQRAQEEWEKEIGKEAEEKTSQPLEKTKGHPQGTKTRIHGKTNQKTKPSNTKSQNEHDDSQDEPQKWP